MTRKPLLLAAVAVGALLTLSACDSPSGTGETATTASTTTSSAQTNYSPPTSTFEAAPADTRDTVDTSDVDLETELIEAFESGGIVFPYGFATDYADIVCEGMADGLTTDDAVMAGLYGFGDTYDIMEHKWMVGMSILLVCPDYA